MEISIKDKQYGLLWGLAAIDRFCNTVQLELEDALNLIFKDTTGNPNQAIAQTIALSKFTVCAIDSYAKVNGTEDGATSEQILQEFDEKGVPLITAILEDFMQSKILGQSVSDYLGVTVVATTDPAIKKKGSRPAK
jgi:hypothetical protein